MDTWIILAIVAVVLLALVVGGAVATGRRTRAQEPELQRSLRAANDALAAAHADDKGWDPDALHEAARAAAAAAHPGVEVEALHLVAVDDRPGVENDRAIFRVVVAGADHALVLGRTGSGDAWITLPA